MLNLNNGEYWKERFEQLENSAHNRSVKTIQGIDAELRKAERTIDGQINAWYQRVAKNNNITMAEARKLLTDKELKEFKWDVQEYIKYGRENAVDEMWIKELENASARVHISRLEQIKLQTQQVCEELYGKQLGTIDDHIRQTYQNDYYHTLFEVQKGTNVGWNVASVDENMLEKLIKKPWTADGKNFSERIWGSKTQLIDSLHTNLTQMCMLGQSPDKAIKNIEKAFGTSRYQAGRLVMTESAYISSLAHKDAFNELDVEEFEVVATLDSRTSEICQEMDGQHFPMKDYEIGVTVPPFHPNCRSTTVPYFDDEFSKGERVARDKDGNRVYVPSDMTYKEWKKTFVGNTNTLTNSPKDNIINTPNKSSDDKYNEILDRLQRNNVDYNPVVGHTTKLTQEEVINTISGGDMTGGSCASVGLAYIGQKQGWNVLDFRGGMSENIFSNSANLKKWSEMKVMKVLRADGASSMTVGKRLLKQVEVGKEYYLCVGRHASIVRKTDEGVLQYLELQSATQSGWRDFHDKTLNWRFGCSTRSDNSSYWDFMLDIDESDFTSNDDFRTLLGYINTDANAQRKGSNGTIK